MRFALRIAAHVAAPLAAAQAPTAATSGRPHPRTGYGPAATSRLHLLAGCLLLILGSACDSAGPEPPPSAPVSLRVHAAVPGLRSLTLSWTASGLPADATLRIERRPESSSDPDTVYTLPPTTTSFMDDGLVVGRYYVYHIQAQIGSTRLDGGHAFGFAGLSIPTRAEVRDVVVDEARGRVYAAVFDGPFVESPVSYLLVADARSLEPIREVPIAAGPYGGAVDLELSPAGDRLLIALHAAGDVLEIDLETFADRRIDVSEAVGNVNLGGIAATGDGRYLVWANTWNGGYVNGEPYAHLARLDLATGTATRLEDAIPHAHTGDGVGRVFPTPDAGRVILTGRSSDGVFLRLDVRGDQLAIDAQQTTRYPFAPTTTTDRTLFIGPEAFDIKTLASVAPLPNGWPYARPGGREVAVFEYGTQGSVGIYDSETRQRLRGVWSGIQSEYPVALAADAPLAYVARQDAVYLLPLDESYRDDRR